MFLKRINNNRLVIASLHEDRVIGYMITSNISNMATQRFDVKYHADKRRFKLQWRRAPGKYTYWIDVPDGELSEQQQPMRFDIEAQVRELGADSLLPDSYVIQKHLVPLAYRRQMRQLTRGRRIPH